MLCLVPRQSFHTPRLLQVLDDREVAFQYLEEEEAFLERREAEAREGQRYAERMQAGDATSASSFPISGSWNGKPQAQLLFLLRKVLLLVENISAERQGCFKALLANPGSATMRF